VRRGVGDGSVGGKGILAGCLIGRETELVLGRQMVGVWNRYLRSTCQVCLPESFSRVIVGILSIFSGRDKFNVCLL